MSHDSRGTYVTLVGAPLNVFHGGCVSWLCLLADHPCAGWKGGGGGYLRAEKDLGGAKLWGRATLLHAERPW